MYSPFQREHHEDSKQKGNQGDRAYFRDEFLVIPFFVLHLYQRKPGNDARDKRNAQVDEDALRNLADGNIHDHSFEAEHGRKHCDENVGVN